ncbi:sensor histidine kinase [Halohasta litorea]|uniref:histidine kinase n=1 Tax=Halohasta litorea TaxID=869891 RepID=A0ABD6DAD7_9EURY|nr:ATP-binding protein [Halohasta litorea]
MDSDQPITVLYVNDSSELLELVSTQLTAEGDRVSVLTATSVEEGIEIVRTTSVDCVLSDYHMPERTGVDFLQAVREMNPELPFIMFTQTGNEAAASEAISADVTDYVIQETIGNQSALLVQKITTHVEYRRQQQRIEQENRRFRQLVETTSDAFWVFSSDWEELLFVNSAHEQLFGQSTERLDAEPQSFLNHLHPDDVDRVKQAMSRAIAGQKVQIEYRVERSEALTAWVESRCKPVRDDDGQIQCLAGYTKEITNRKEHEAELLVKNEQLSEFTGTVAHDLRNPLNVADGTLELAATECDSEHLETARDAVTQMDTLIDELLALAKEGEEIDDRSVISFAELLREGQKNIVMPKATLEIEGRATLNCDPARVREALENLFRNALEHGGESITITAGILESDDGFYIEDDGPGIPDDDQEAVFDRGYTTTRQGSGYGLSIVKGIVEAHGWEINVKNGSSGGARFEVTEIDLH